MPATRVAEVTRSGLAAALSLARRLGLQTADPEVLSSRGNLLVHLAPSAVVARVATLTASSRQDPFSWLAREVQVAGYAYGRGGPVVPPASVVDPGPHWQHGFAVSLWDYVPPAPRRPVPAEVGTALARLHRAAAGCPAKLGDLSPAQEQVSDGLEVLERASVLETSTIAALRARHAAVLAALPSAVAPAVLHGDAHAGNLLFANGSWRWIDLEETCRGPTAWDLAVLAGQSGAGAAEVLRGYARESGEAVVSAADLAPFQRARQLEAAVWTLCMARLYPARYSQTARDLLARALTG